MSSGVHQPGHSWLEAVAEYLVTYGLTSQELVSV
jgi:hypothetical protein